MVKRLRLANRRACESFTFELDRLRFTTTIGRFPNGKVGEIFLQNHKPGSQSDFNARDSAIAASLALQHGTPLETLRKAILRALIAGTTPIAASGTTAAAVLHDIRLLLDAATVSTNSRFHLIASPTICARLAVMTTATIDGLAFPALTVNGGMIGGIQVHASAALTNAVVLIDAAQLVASADAVAIRVSQNASLEMDTAPAQAIATGSPPAPAGPAGSPPPGLVSMFQTNSTAILCERVFGFQPLRASAVQR